MLGIPEFVNNGIPLFMPKDLQVTDEEGNKVPGRTVAIMSRTLDRIQDEIRRIRDSEGKGTPAAGVVIERMWKAYEAAMQEIGRAAMIRDLARSGVPASDWDALLLSVLDAEGKELVHKLIALLQDPDPPDMARTVKTLLKQYEPKLNKNEVAAKKPRRIVG